MVLIAAVIVPQTGKRMRASFASFYFRGLGGGGMISPTCLWKLATFCGSAAGPI